MMTYLLILQIMMFTSLFVIYKPFRYYCLSYFFGFLWKHKELAKFLGVKFESNLTWKPSAKDVQVYVSGIYPTLIIKFLQIKDFDLNDVRNQIMRQQIGKAKNINITSYLDELDGKEMSLTKFYEFVSICVLKELDRIFLIFKNEEQLSMFNKHVSIFADVFVDVVGDWKLGMKKFFKHLDSMWYIYKILGELDPDKKLIALVSHISSVHTFCGSLLKNLKENVEHNFINSNVGFLPYLYKGELYLMSFDFSDKISPQSPAFGPLSRQCPGSNIAYNLSKSYVQFYNDFDFKINGSPIYHYDVINRVQNRDKIMLSFKKKVK